MVKEQRRYTDNSRQVNNSRVYYGVQGAHALQPDVVREPERRKQTRVNIRKKHDLAAKSKIKAVGLVIVGMLMLCMLVQRYAVIAINNLEIQNMQQSIEQVSNQGAYLDVELAKKEDIVTVEQIAKEELNMDYPDTDRIQYVQYSGVSVSDDEPETAPAEKSLFDCVCDWIFDLGRRISS